MPCQYVSLNVPTTGTTWINETPHCSTLLPLQSRFILPWVSSTQPRITHNLWVSGITPRSTRNLTSLIQRNSAAARMPASNGNEL